MVQEVTLKIIFKFLDFSRVWNFVFKFKDFSRIPGPVGTLNIAVSGCVVGVKASCPCRDVEFLSVKMNESHKIVD